MTAPSVLALVRHGESRWIEERRFQGRGDSELSDRGRRQAAAVGARLARPRAMPAVPVPAGPALAIWHSPLLRAAQTASAIASARGEADRLLPLPALTEIAQGEWEGRTHQEVSTRWAAQLQAWRDDPLHHHAPGGESLEAATARAREGRAAILSDGPAGGRSEPLEAPAEPVLGYRSADGPADLRPWSIVVAHDGILRLLLLDLLGLPVDRFWRFPLALASITVLDFGAGFAQLRAHNLDEHIVALELDAA
jgi:broad specificity phosphatase PhoE